MTRRLMAILMLSLSLAVTGCEDDVKDPPPDDAYLPQTSEDNVLSNLQHAYRLRDIAAYARLLAIDCLVYPDPATAERLGIDFWTRTEDSLITAALFSSPEVKKIDIELGWPHRSAADANLPPPRDTWSELLLVDIYLDIDIRPEGQETTTYRVENQPQRLYFRRGRTNPPSGAADTLTYIVEWHDKGVTNIGSTRSTQVEPSTWSGTKSLFFHPTAEHSYLPQTSEDNVLENFQRAYRTRNARAYARLLAADFQFHFDPVTREGLGISFWTRTQDSLSTEGLFTEPRIPKIVIELDWPRGSATGAGFLPPRHTWTKIFVNDVFLDVDFAPIGQEVTTYRVENQTQRFFFRRGRTYPPSGPADTLVYLVEWRDQGVSGFHSAGLTQAPTTWSGIKTLLRE